MSRIYIYSTLTASQLYTNWAQGGADMPIPAGQVHIAGGAGIADSRLVTPRGVVTEVTPEQLAILEANDDFVLHRKNGFIEVSQERVDPEIAAADMASRDGGAPLVPQDFAPDEQPKIGTPGADDGPVIPPLPTAPATTAKKR